MTSLLNLQEFLFLLVVFIANTVESMTGFAGTLLAMPASMQLIGVDEAKTVLNVISLLCCIWITISCYKDTNWKELFKITIFMMLGMIVGIVLFDFVPVSILLKFYALLIIFIALWKFFAKKEFNLSRNFLLWIVVMAGVVHGLFLSGGSLLVIYAAIALKTKKEFRATLAPLWVILDSFLFLNQVRLGHLNETTIPLILWSIIPLSLGIMLGIKLFTKINHQNFLKLTYILLFISGISLLLT